MPRQEECWRRETTCSPVLIRLLCCLTITGRGVLGQDPAVIGRTFRMTNNLTGARIYQIVGVAGAGFTGTEPGKVVDIFLPAMMHWGAAYPEWLLFRGFVHLRPGASAMGVRDRLRATFEAFQAARGNRTKQVLEMNAADAGVSPMQKNYSASLAILSVLVALVLLIACANVANRMMAQTAARAREMALRISIGAGARQLGQLILAETTILGLFATGLGRCFAQWAGPFVLARINPPDDPARLSLAVDWRILAFGFLLTFWVILFLGIAPAFRASAVRPVEALKGGDDPHSRGRSRACYGGRRGCCGFAGGDSCRADGCRGAVTSGVVGYRSF